MIYWNIIKNPSEIEVDMIFLLCDLAFSNEPVDSPQSETTESSDENQDASKTETSSNEETDAEESDEQVKDIENVALDFAESQLHQQIGKGIPSSTMFYLKTKGKHRGYVERTEITGADGMPNNFQIEIIDKTEDTN